MDCVEVRKIAKRERASDRMVSEKVSINVQMKEAMKLPEPKFKIVTTKRNWVEKAKDKPTAFKQASKKLQKGEKILFNMAWNKEAILSCE